MKIKITNRFILAVLLFALSTSQLHAIQLGDEVIVAQDKSAISVRSKANTAAIKQYQIEAGDKGIVLQGPVSANGYQWFLIDWDDSDWEQEKGWTALVNAWYGPTGQTLISKLTLAQELAEEFFKNRPDKLGPQGDYSDDLKLSYKQKRENGFKSLDRSNKNMRLALEAIRINDLVTAYREYKYAIVQLNNTKQFFNEAVEILDRTETG